MHLVSSHASAHLFGWRASPIRFLGDHAVQEIVVLRWETAAELPKERTQAQRAMGIVVLLDGQRHTEASLAPRASKPVKSFR